MRKFIIMGIQGSGKGTQAKLLADDLELEHVSVGDIFRWNVQHHTKLGAQVKRIMAAGHLVDDDLVEAVVRDRLAEHDWNFGFIIDGFPRNARQAEFFLESLRHRRRDQPEPPRRGGRPAGAGPTAVLPVRPGLQPDGPPAPARPTSAMSAAAPSRPGPTTTPRPWPSDWPQYHEETKPLIEIFERKEFVATVDATLPVDEVQDSIRERFALPARTR